MSATGVNLHLRRKNVLLYVLGYVLIILLLTAAVAVPTIDNLAQLQAMAGSNYMYSAVTTNSVAQDAYYRYNAGLSFSISKDTKTGINAEVVMQTENAQYTEMVYWNADRLSENAVAISQNIASTYGINVGDILYSKNIVDGEIHEFTIEAVLPAVIYTRGYAEDFHNDGVIVMGYDSLYAENVAYTCIVFTQKPIEELAQLCTSMPEDIAYRDDEIFSLVRNIVPYMALYLFGIAAAIVILSACLSKDVSSNFRRLIMLGFEKKELNKTYYGYIGKIGVFSIAITLIVAGVAFAGVGWIASVPVVCLATIGIFALMISAIIMNKHLWRK